MAFELAVEQSFEGQEWEFAPGPRTVEMHVRAPQSGVVANTGLMLVLHNWGGRYKDAHYLTWCAAFADKFNVIAVSVNYLQSGEDARRENAPYDHGYLQAMDCLRALYHVQKQLDGAGVLFNRYRCYTMGGSGGGNVSLMANKFAPHSFACVVDICGMPGLTDSIAYGETDATTLNAGYSRDLQSPRYLSTDMQEIRNPGHPGHLRQQFAANPHNKVVIVHGLDDTSCPVTDKISIYGNMVAAGFQPDGHFLTPWHVDGEAVTTTGHAVGARDRVTYRFADAYLSESGRLALQVVGPNDFERAHAIEYPTSNGRFVVDFTGVPLITFASN